MGSWELLISIAAVLVAAASFLVQLWSSRRSARREEVQDLRDSYERKLEGARDAITALRDQHQHELETLRAEHRRCETKLIALEAQFDELSKRYLAVLEEAVRRGMNPQVVVHAPAASVAPAAAPDAVGN